MEGIFILFLLFPHCPSVLISLSVSPINSKHITSSPPRAATAADTTVTTRTARRRNPSRAITTVKPRPRRNHHEVPENPPPTANPQQAPSRRWTTTILPLSDLDRFELNQQEVTTQHLRSVDWPPPSASRSGLLASRTSSRLRMLAVVVGAPLDLQRWLRMLTPLLWFGQKRLGHLREKKATERRGFQMDKLGKERKKKE